MSISFENALGIRESALTLRSHRAGVLSSNLANADTPNFKARDFNFSQALKTKMGSKLPSHMKTTQARHIDTSRAHENFHDLSYRVPHQPSTDGNTVEEQVEHAEFMKNNLEFQAAFTLLNSSFKGLRKAIKGE